MKGGQHDERDSKWKYSPRVFGMLRNSCGAWSSRYLANVINGYCMKQKTCAICRIKFIPSRQMQKVCSPLCAAEYGRKQHAKAEMVKALEDRKTIKLRKEKLKTRSDYIKEAQIAVNAYVRERDKNASCISCGTSFQLESVGGWFDAGHYRSRGSSPHLRFDAERNIFGQCKRCNRYLGGAYSAYRRGLIARIGEQKVIELEADNTPRKWTIEELKAIRDEYKRKLKELKRVQ